MGAVEDRFEVRVGNGAPFHVEVSDGVAKVYFHPGDAPPMELFSGWVAAVDGVLALTPHAWPKRPEPDADLLEYVNAAIRERAPAWGPIELWGASDWAEVFKYAASPTGVEGYAGDTSGFAIRDVAEVIAMVDGENDGASWCGAFRLRDGRFAFVEASCDYTGWG